MSPAFDLLFLANVLWPLALVPAAAGATGPLTVWQLYFLTTPHRWLTLLLVAADPDRRDGRGRVFAGLAVAVCVFVAGWYACGGGIGCLLLIDLVWNGWHFGSQHAGVARLYGKASRASYPVLEKHLTRLFVFYAALRVPAFVAGVPNSAPEARSVVMIVDWVMLVVPTLLFATAGEGLVRGQGGRAAYLVSVAALYSGLLLAAHFESTPLVVGFALASAAFHATEYIALVTHYAWRRQHVGSAGLFRDLAGKWLAVLAGFAVALALAQAAAGSAFGELWVGVNLAASFLHYAYDGMIWKLRRPDTARALLGPPAGAAA